VRLLQQPVLTGNIIKVDIVIEVVRRKVSIKEDFAFTLVQLVIQIMDMVDA